MSAAKHTQTQDIDPRGIHRKQARVIVDPSGGTTLVQFECGHIGEMAQHFTYKVGDVRFCFKCGKEAKARNSHDALVAENKNLRDALARYVRRDHGYNEAAVSFAVSKAAKGEA